jgi:hypothetical protein
MVRSQIANLTFGPSFGHNLCLKCPNGSCEPILDIYGPKAFKWYRELFNPMGFDPLQLLYEDLGIHRDFNSQNGSSFGSVGVHSLIFSHTPRSMICDFWASFLAHTLASLCLGHEPKAKVVTFSDIKSYNDCAIKISSLICHTKISQTTKH